MAPLCKFGQSARNQLHAGGVRVQRVSLRRSVYFAHTAVTAVLPADVYSRRHLSEQTE